MIKTVTDSANDAHLLEIANFGDAVHINRLAPTNYHEAVTTLSQNTSGTALLRNTLTLSDGAGDWTIGEGDTDGRKVNLAQQATITISETDNANHLSIVSDVRSALLLVTTVTSQAVTAANTATINTFDLEVRDPT